MQVVCQPFYLVEGKHVIRYLVWGDEFLAAAHTKPMENDRFIARINRILAEQAVALPVVSADGAPDSKAVAVWASFLQECVRAGIQLSDPRWQRLRVIRDAPVTELALDESTAEDKDEEFRLGLQLLVGILSDKR